MAVQWGFSLIAEDPGVGKSKTLQQIAHRLEQVPDLTVGVMYRPQSALGDFYRELEELFNVGLSVANRYGRFKALRQRWLAHCKSTLLKPVLLIDEVQHVSVECLTDLRLLQSNHLDLQSLLFTILRRRESTAWTVQAANLLSLGSRIWPRLVLSPIAPE